MTTSPTTWYLDAECEGSLKVQSHVKSVLAFSFDLCPILEKVNVKYYQHHLLPHFYRPQMKLREGNVLTCVCLSTVGLSHTHPRKEHGIRQEVTSYPLEGTWDQTGSDIIPPEPQKRAVRILLECFLVQI